MSAPPLRRPSDPQAYPLHWGPIQFHPSLGYGVSYGDGILRDPGAPQETVLHTLSPGLAAELGRFWDLVMGVTLNRYSNASSENNTGYNVALSGNIPLEKWAFSFGGVWSLSDEPQIETGAQTEQQAYSLTAGGSYNRNTRLSYDFGVSQNTELTEEFANYWAWSTSEWLNYHATTKTSLGLGVGGGYNLIDPGDDSTFEQFNGRIVWLPGPKLNVQLSVGVQFQQFLGENTTTEVFPLFSAAVAYQVFEPTSLAVAASHSIENSVLTGQITETTSVSVGLRQRVLRHLSFDLRPGYQFDSYKSTAGLSVSREDDVFSLYAGLSTVLFKKLTSTVFYQFHDNSSTDAVQTFSSTQVGLQLNYRY